MRTLAPFLLIGSLLCADIAWAGNVWDLNHAITELNETGKARNARLTIYAVISLQTNVPVGKLMADSSANRLSYGELLVAELIAKATAKPVQMLVAQQQKNRSWAQVAKQNRISLESLTARLHAARESMHVAENSYRQRQLRQQQQQEREDIIIMNYKISPQQAPAVFERHVSPIAGRQPMAPLKKP